jgi:hypothetical protein
MRYDARNGIRFSQRYIGVDDVRYDLIQKVANVDKTTSLTFYNGNVGIGNTEPAGALQVGVGRLRIANGSSDSTTIGTTDTTDSFLNTRITLYGYDKTDIHGDSGSIAYCATNTGNHYFVNYDTAERVQMIIANSGNVGIGTMDTTTYKLNVNGSQFINNQLKFSDRYISNDNFTCNKITLYPNGFGFGISNGTLDYFSTGNHKFSTGATTSAFGTKRLEIKTNGAVAIQTTGAAIPSFNSMAAGSLVIGNINQNYGWLQGNRALSL